MEEIMRLVKYMLVATLSAITANAYATVQIPEVKHPIIIKKMPTNMKAGPSDGLSPQQLKSVYGIDKISNQGQGQIIAIIVPYDDPTIGSDLATFDAAFNLPDCKLVKVYSTGVKPGPDPDGGWTSETALDVEWAHAIAPAATIYIVEAPTPNFPNLYDAVKVAVASGANVVSMSFGAAEGPWIKAFKVDETFNVPNVNFVASTGDAGHEVNYPAASPYVISVGGTSLTINPTTGKRATETAWTYGGGGLSTIEPASDQQKAYVLPNNPNQMRGVPDVAYHSDANLGGYPIYNNNAWQIVGGTSAGAPQWAGIIAIANSVAKKNIPVNKLLYGIAKQNYKMSFHDVRKGQNGTCGYFCQAQVGYDYVTGLGAPHSRYIINQLISQS